MPRIDQHHPTADQAAPHTYVTRLAGGLVAACMLAVLSLGHGGVPWAAAAERPPSPGSVFVREGLLTVDVRHARLADVLRLIGERAGLRVRIDGAVGGLITAAFSGMPLDQGIRRLVRGHSLALIYAAPQGNVGAPQLTEVRVYAAAPPDDQRPGRIERLADREPSATPVGESEGPRDEAAIPTLAQALGQDPDPRVRAEAVAALTEIGGLRAAGVLTAALRDADASIRLEGVAALSALGGATARKALASALRHDPDPHVRRAAARALIPYAGEAEVRRALSAAASDPDSSVGEEAASILVQGAQRDARRGNARGTSD